MDKCILLDSDSLIRDSTRRRSFYARALFDVIFANGYLVNKARGNDLLEKFSLC